MNNLKNIIMVYHIPVDGLTRRTSEEMMDEYYEALSDDRFQAVLIFPYTDGTPKKK